MLNTFLAPLGSPADADAAFFALVGGNDPIRPGFVRVRFDSGFNGESDSGKKCYFYIKPDGTAQNPSTVWAGDAIQDCSRSIDIVTQADVKEEVDLFWNLRGGTWWFVAPSKKEYQLNFTPAMDGTRQFLYDLLAPL